MIYNIYKNYMRKMNYYMVSPSNNIHNYWLKIMM